MGCVYQMGGPPKLIFLEYQLYGRVIDSKLLLANVIKEKIRVLSIAIRNLSEIRIN